ncbi:MAG: helix-turn-helix transcriptional regulator [Mycetocola reblochoni]|uniref:helix-turn-helix transcriptional regulator n=1 Tax=Mycetocola reblochoni TaxID=331618 RepID=UPI003F98053B
MTMEQPRTITLGLRVLLRESRLAAGLEQAQMAEIIGVSRGTISGWERGKAEPTLTYALRWADACGVTIEWLASGVRANENPPLSRGASGVVRPEGLEPPTF